MTIDGAFLAGLGALLGALIGLVTFLFRALVASKNETIRVLTEDRNYWKTLAQSLERHA